jgi:ribosome maturation factor RimP
LFAYALKPVKMKSKVPERLNALIEPIVTKLGYELVGIEFDARVRVLRVYIDQATGIVVDDCSRVSYQISGMLDVEDPIPGQYQLEVSSPGMDRPLFELGHFQRFIGSIASIHLRRPIGARRRIKGRLTAIEGDEVLVEEETGTVRLPFDAIDRARLVPEFPMTTNKG